MLQRRFGLLQAVSLNMSMMVGIGPFITIPAFVAQMGGPHAIVGWIFGAMLALADGMVWSELASAFPGSGGTYHFYEAAYGESKLGRLLKFLFVWQFLFSAPLEVATGAIGLAQYVSYFFPGLAQPAWSLSLGSLNGGTAFAVTWEQVLAVFVLAAITGLAYRKIEVAGRLMVILWIGMLITVGWVILSGLSHFDPSLLRDVPPDAWTLDRKHMLGFGMALSIAMYDFLGYYQICYLGDEVADPSRTIPRSILISVLAIGAIYLTMNVSILGVVPWREIVATHHVASDMMAKVYGQGAANAITVMIIWTAAASTFAAVLGYSRVPYASARAGHFYRAFARLHPKGDFPHRSLLLVSGLAMFACLFDLETVIKALLASRILIQFVVQILTVFYLRGRSTTQTPGNYRMPWYPLPACLALAGWLFLFGTSEAKIMAYGGGSLLLGWVAFRFWEAAGSKARPDPESAG